MPDPVDPSLAPRPADRLVAVAAVVVIVFGVIARLIGQTTIELWADEADWAIRAATGTDTFIRPAGSMWLAKHTTALKNNEAVLRLPSLIAGIASLPLLYAVLRRLVRPAVGVLAVLVLAVHPVAVAMAREFKPYAVEATLHLLVLWLALRLVHAPSPRRAIALVTTTVLSPLLSWSIVFSYPGAYLLGLWHRRDELRRGERRTAVVVVVGAVLTLIVLGVLFAMRVGGEDRHTEYWGDKYGVFYTRHDVLGQIAWSFRKTISLAMWPLRLDLPRNTAWLWGQYAFAVAVVVGLVTLIVRRRFSVLTLLVLPFATTLLFNVLGQWPWGIFRTNFYLLPLTVVFAAIGVDVLVDGLRRLHPRVPGLAAAVVTVLVVLCVPRWWDHFDEKIRGSQTGQAEMHKAMGLLRAVETKTPTPLPSSSSASSSASASSSSGKRLLLLDGHACGLFTYYKDHHDVASAEHSAWFDAHITTRCAALNKAGWYPVLEAAEEPFWVIVVQRILERQTVARLSERCVVSHKHKLRGMTLLHCSAKPGRAAPSPAPPSASAPASDADDEDDEDDEGEDIGASP